MINEPLRRPRGGTVPRVNAPALDAARDCPILSRGSALPPILPVGCAMAKPPEIFSPPAQKWPTNEVAGRFGACARVAKGDGL